MKKLLLIYISTFIFSVFSFSQEYGWVDISTNAPSGTYNFTDVHVRGEQGEKVWCTSFRAIAPFYTYYSGDGALTWEEQETGHDQQAIYMLNDTEGYTGGMGGILYRKTDTTVWTALLNSIPQLGHTITSITFPPNSDSGWCCGGNFAAKISEVGIYEKEHIVIGDLNSISFPTSNQGWTCDPWNAFKYSNGNWTGQACFGNSIYFVPNTVFGWAVGDNGSIYHTENGIDWEEQFNPDTILTRTFNDVFFLNEQEGWAVGDLGLILHTTNGGENWQIEADGLTNELLQGVYFVTTTNGKVGYVVGNNSTILKCTQVTGVEEKSKIIPFVVYPNPANNKIQIECSDFKSESGKIELLSLDGKEIIKKEIGKGNENIELD